ncbi:MAG: CPBP family intramembrane metalloprotease [Opitutae bacterium]|nr:CPBP family intramembrane metalloprotease [Opitutae bacterium]
MPASVLLRPLLPIATAMALLLTAGVAASIHLATRPRAGSTPWKIRLAQFAAASPWRGKDVLLLVLVLSGAQAVRSFLRGGSIAWDLLAFQGVLLAGILWRARGKARPFGARAPARAIAAQAALRWLAILPVLWFSAFVWQLLLKAAGHAPDFQQAVRLFLEAGDPWTRAGFIFFAVGIAPLAEEALFRGILLPLLIRRTGAVAGLALTTLGFAALHADLGTFVPLAVFSVALSLAYARTGTLWVPIAMHALFNSVNLGLLLALDRAGVV